MAVTKLTISFLLCRISKTTLSFSFPSPYRTTVTLSSRQQVFNITNTHKNTSANDSCFLLFRKPYHQWQTTNSISSQIRPDTPTIPRKSTAVNRKLTNCPAIFLRSNYTYTPLSHSRTFALSRTSSALLSLLPHTSSGLSPDGELFIFGNISW